MKFRASEVAAAVGGALVGDDVVLDGVSIDSRTIRGGELFVAIVGERDGHEFVQAAVAAGAGACLTASQGRHPTAAIVVPDTAIALREIGRLARARIDGPVIGITGSVGKTSTKDLCAAILRRTRDVAASPESFNNELGVPLTLANGPDGARAAVIEMGARGIGHIAALAEIARPTIGVVTTIVAAHTEMFGSVDDIARAKGELVEALPPDGTAVLNAGDRRVDAMASRTLARVLRFGDGGDVRAGAVAIDADLRPTFRLQTPWGSGDVRLAARGAHQVDNALAATAAAMAAGVGIDDVVVGLATAVMSKWRMELVRTNSGAVVINDAYNANPASMSAALRAVAALPARRRVAVLGEMAELGANAAREHRDIAVLAHDLGVRVIAVATDVYAVDDVVADPSGAVRLLGAITEGDAVLVKASRVAGLQHVVDLLLADPGSGA